MATGTVTYYIPSEDGGLGSQRTLNRIKIVETWNDVTNTSTFVITVQGMRSSGSLNTKWFSRGTLSFNGTEIISHNTGTGNMTLNYSDGWKDMLTVTVSDVAHNADGSLSVTIGRETYSSFPGWCMNGVYNSTNYYGNCGSGDYTLTCHTNTVGTVKIDNGSSFDSYLVYIDNGSSWDQYLPYVEDGSSWSLCGG